MRKPCFVTAWALVLTMTAYAAAQDRPRDRGITGVEANLSVPPFELQPAAVNAPALYFVSAARNCSGFDLKGATLNLVLTSEVQVYPLVYKGKVGNVYIYDESSPYGWRWYFVQGSGMAGEIYFQTNPQSAIITYDVNAKVYARTP
jgi:hypothetical protein